MGIPRVLRDIRVTSSVALLLRGKGCELVMGGGIGMLLKDGLLRGGGEGRNVFSRGHGLCARVRYDHD